MKAQVQRRSSLIQWLDRLLGLTIRELRGFFNSVIAWIAMMVFLLINGCLFFALIEYYTSAQEQSISSAGQLFKFCLFLLTFLCPALSMKLIAAEWQNRSLEGLLTAPVSETQVVLSKYFGAMGFYCAMIACLGIYLALLSIFGSWDKGPIYTSFLGLILVGGLFLSAGLFASSLTQSQLVAFLMTFLFNLLITWGVSLIDRFLMPHSLLRMMANAVMVNRHFNDLTRGLLSTHGLTFFLSSITLFLFLTIRSLESRRWS